MLVFKFIIEGIFYFFKGIEVKFEVNLCLILLSVGKV